jgi:DNA-binding response OmpR family regulator
MTMPAITEADLRAAQRDGQSQAEAARRFGVSHNTVLRAEARHGIHLERRRERQPWTTHKDVVAEMRPAEAVEYLLEVIARLQDPIKPVWVWRGVHMPPKQKLILRCLAEAKGAVVPREAIMRAYMAGSAGDIGPDMKVLDVQICRMRPVVAPHGIEIITVHSEGYALYAPPGFVWPWDE